MAGEVWADEIYGFETVDTEISRYTLDGLILWLDATDINGDGEKDDLSINLTSLCGWISP